MKGECRTVHLEVNDSGAWRRVTVFDRDALDGRVLQTLVEELLSISLNERLRARIRLAGEIAPLMTWTHADGWRRWAHTGRRST